MFEKIISRRVAVQGVTAAVAIGAVAGSVSAAIPLSGSMDEKIIVLSQAIQDKLKKREGMSLSGNAWIYVPETGGHRLVASTGTTPLDAEIRTDLARLRKLWYSGSPTGQSAANAQTAVFRKAFEVLGRTAV